MSFKEYIKEKSIFLFINIIIFGYFYFLFYIYNVNRSFMLLILILWLMPIVTFLIGDFFKKKTFYTRTITEFEELDKKYLIGELIKEPVFLEGKILCNMLKKTSKSMYENINRYKYLQQEYREYIELWVHEVKTPISSSKLIIENNKNEVTLSILEEIVKIEEYIEQALYYSRSNNTEEDYVVKKFRLKKVVNEVIKRNSKHFIKKKIRLEVDGLDENVYSDTKWIQFVLNQIIVNSINYSKSENSIIKICAKKNKSNIILYIEDNGIGISAEDLPMVFKKGFTGFNGRINKKSTGIGLYLCKKLCDKLGLAIEVTSEINIGTKVQVAFPLSEMMLFE